MKKEDLIKSVYENSLIKSLLGQLDETERKNTERAMSAVIDQMHGSFGKLSKAIEEHLADVPPKTEANK